MLHRSKYTPHKLETNSIFLAKNVLFSQTNWTPLKHLHVQSIYN